MSYEYLKPKSLEETIKETEERIRYQDNFMNFLVQPFVTPLYLGLSRSVYKQVKCSGLENLDEIKKSRCAVITYNHMIDYDAVEIICRLFKAGIHPASVAFQDLFYKSSKALTWLVEGTGAFPVFNDGTRFERTKLNNFFNQFWAYLCLKRPVTIAINGEITRERVFPKPHNGLAHVLLNAPEQINIPTSEIKIMPVGVALIANMNEYNKVFFDEKHYRNLVVRAVAAFSMLYKKSSLYLSFGKPFTLESALKNFSAESEAEARNLLSAGIMKNIKAEISTAWKEFDLEKRYGVSSADYLKEE
ncbi:MAG: hypothetical protein NTV63_05150 [Candidatus Woesearchaeota archaeon]|nr:hypothetical protein [Candidatus Woesearchaeota archaeon]